MTKQELLDKLKECSTMGDTENSHYLADQALLEFIDDSDIDDVYTDIKKWYA